MSINYGSEMCLIAGKMIAFVLCARVKSILVYVNDFKSSKRIVINDLEAYLKCSYLIGSNSFSKEQ